MNREQLQRDFFPAEIMLKLYRDLAGSGAEAKIELIDEYIEKVRDSYDEDVLYIKQHNQIAHIYCMSEQHKQAISHFEMVVEKMAPDDYPPIYFLAINLLIRSNCILTNYDVAKKWGELALKNHHHADPISKLHILNDYMDVLSETETDLDKKHYSVIQSIIDEYGFPEKLGDPVETVRSMNKRHKFWARKMGDLTLAYAKTDGANTFEDLEQYIESCEIGWYKVHALKSLDLLKNKSAQG
ncbi:hypothetical protein [Algoriphagus yeomjeoni]|uniref:Tetratricopeptide repeat protein n=1 Tax=Algoriphagus yeomjeoni TaxID=291403 RepID=A0A327PAL8_9BACT|nr:hypothetical protein [Algoriphagus yeomjeoni]RAI89330.1 hypothetical protein LV83_02371 [Algoriphagus yeomjeoni]